MRTQIPNEDEVWFRLRDFAKRWKAEPAMKALETEQVLPPSNVVRFQLGTVAIWEHVTAARVKVQLQLLLEPQQDGKWEITTAAQLPGCRMLGKNLHVSWSEVIALIEDFEHHLNPGTVH